MALVTGFRVMVNVLSTLPVKLPEPVTVTVAVPAAVLLEYPTLYPDDGTVIVPTVVVATVTRLTAGVYAVPLYSYSVCDKVTTAEERFCGAMVNALSTEPV